MSFARAAVRRFNEPLEPAMPAAAAQGGKPFRARVHTKGGSLVSPVHSCTSAFKGSRDSTAHHSPPGRCRTSSSPLPGKADLAAADEILLGACGASAAVASDNVASPNNEPTANVASSGSQHETTQIADSDCAAPVISSCHLGTLLTAKEEEQVDGGKPVEDSLSKSCCTVVPDCHAASAVTDHSADHLSEVRRLDDEAAFESAALLSALQAEAAASRATISALKEQLAAIRAVHKETQEALCCSEDDSQKLQKLLDEMRHEHGTMAAEHRQQLEKLRCLEKVVKSLGRATEHTMAYGDASADGPAMLRQYCDIVQAENEQLKGDLRMMQQLEHQAKETVRHLRSQLSAANDVRQELEEKQRHLLQENLALTGRMLAITQECESSKSVTSRLLAQRESAQQECDKMATALRDAQCTLAEQLSRDHTDVATLTTLHSEKEELQRLLTAARAELAAALASLAADEAARKGLEAALASAEKDSKQKLEAAKETALVAQAELATIVGRLRDSEEALVCVQGSLALCQARCSALADENAGLSRKCEELEKRSSDWICSKQQLQHAESLRALLATDLESARAMAASASAEASAARRELLDVRAQAAAAADGAGQVQERLTKSNARVEELLTVNCQLSEKLVAQSSLYRQIDEQRVLVARVRTEANAQLEAAVSESNSLQARLDKATSDCHVACDEIRRSAHFEQEQLRMQLEEYCRRVVELQTKLAACNCELLRLRPGAECSPLLRQCDRLGQNNREQVLSEGGSAPLVLTTSDNVLDKVSASPLLSKMCVQPDLHLRVQNKLANLKATPFKDSTNVRAHV